MPFLTTSSGSTRWPASRPVISSAKLERIPLHSLAISIVTPGNAKVNPLRWTGTPASWNSPWETSADHVCSQKMILSTRSREWAPSETGTGRERGPSAERACRSTERIRRPRSPATRKSRRQGDHSRSPRRSVLARASRRQRRRRATPIPSSNASRRGRRSSFDPERRGQR